MLRDVHILIISAAEPVPQVIITQSGRKYLMPIVLPAFSPRCRGARTRADMASRRCHDYAR